MKDKPAKQYLEELYQTMSVIQIAKQFGVPEPTMYYWFKQYGIKKRSASESRQRVIERDKSQGKSIINWNLKEKNPLFLDENGNFSNSLYDKHMYQLNKDKIKAKSAEYRKANPEKTKVAIQKWMNDPLNKEKKHKSYRKRYEADRPRYFAAAALRRARKLRASPSWLSESDHTEIKAIYAECIRQNKEAGKIVSHVDHIVPLQGKDVCGLHVPWNLQILPATENLSKHIHIKP